MYLKENLKVAEDPVTAKLSLQYFIMPTLGELHRAKLYKLRNSRV